MPHPGATHEGDRRQLLINPILDACLDDGSSVTTPSAWCCTETGPNIVGTETQRFFSHLIGEKLLVFNASIVDGPRQVTTLPTVQAHVELFFKRYLIRSS